MLVIQVSKRGKHSTETEAEALGHGQGLNIGLLNFNFGFTFVLGYGESGLAKKVGIDVRAEYQLRMTQAKAFGYTGADSGPS